MPEAAEAFTIVFEKSANGPNLIIAWDDYESDTPYRCEII
jgi:hypothetical protein